ncbi:MAG: ROK family transcriptional regulator [Chloroflexi bacterium]|nr:ROK family transcriptional regulator [Chloroflexota bacterium]
MRNQRRPNRLAVLDALRRQGPIPRGRLAEVLDCGVPAARRVLAELEGERLVRPTIAGNQVGGGRGPLIEINPSASLTIGVDLGGTKFYGAVANFGGQILYERLENQHGSTGEQSYAILEEMLLELAEFARGTGIPIQGICVGAPAVVSPETEAVYFAPSLYWQGFPLGDRLRKRFDLPIAVENDVNLSALGESCFGKGRQVENLVLVQIGTGIGMGTVLGRKLFRGSHGAAGEIGSVIPEKQCLYLDYPRFGPLEVGASGFGIAQRAREALAGRLPEAEWEALSAASVFEAYRRGETWPRPIVEEAIDYLAIALVSICAYLDPEMIVIGGGVARSADLLMEPLRQKVAAHVPIMPRFELSELGPQAAVLGAVACLQDRV